MATLASALASQLGSSPFSLGGSLYPFQAIICLGARFKKDGLPSAHLFNRLMQTIKLAICLPDAIIVVTGGTVGVRDFCEIAGVWTTEARMMARFLVLHGIDPKRIYMEEYATETIGNTLFSAKGLHHLRLPGPFILVSQDWHLLRAQPIAQHLCLGKLRFYPYPAPCPLSVSARDLRISTDLVGAGSVEFTERFFAEVPPGDLGAALEWTQRNHSGNPYSGLNFGSVDLVRM